MKSTNSPAKAGIIKWMMMCMILVSIVACTGKNMPSDAYGNFEADETIISAEVGGRLIFLKVEEGQVLDSGFVAGLIDTTDYQLRMEQLMASKAGLATRTGNIASQIEVQFQQKSNLIIDKTRIEKLYSEGAATQKQLDDINGSIRLVDKQIESIRTQNAGIADDLLALEKQIAQIRENIRKCHLINPVKGTVLEKYIMPNEITTAGKSIYKIANLEYIYLRAYISGQQLAGVKNGQNAEILVDAGDGTLKSYPGTVSWISSSAEFTPKIIQTREERINLVYAVKIRVKNDGYLKIGMPGEVNFK